MNKQYLPGQIIGYGKRGPIRLIAGGSEQHVEPPASTAPAPNPTAGGHTFTAADMERARSEERDKLYGRLNTQGTKLNALEQQIAEWQAERQAAAEAQTAAQLAAEEAKRKTAEEEMDLRALLVTKEQEWTARMDSMQRDREQERALLQKDRELAQLQTHIQMRINQERENIAPELIDLVTGNTPEEVESSIALMREKTNSILQGVNSAQTEITSQQRGVSATGYGGADGPLDQHLGSKTYTPEDLASMPMSEYAKLRGSLLGSKATGNGSGLFG